MQLSAARQKHPLAQGQLSWRDVRSGSSRICEHLPLMMPSPTPRHVLLEDGAHHIHPINHMAKDGITGIPAIRLRVIGTLSPITMKKSADAVPARRAPSRWRRLYGSSP